MKRKLLRLFLALLVLPIFSPSVYSAASLEDGIKSLAEGISKSMVAKHKKKIAVIEFSDLNDNVTALGQFIAEELITQLFIVNPGKFEVVERRQLAKVLRQQKLSTTGLLEPKAMLSVGKILGVDAIVTGSITNLGNDIKVNARIIAVDSAKIFGVASSKIPKVGTVITLLSKPKIGKNESGGLPANNPSISKTNFSRAKVIKTITDHDIRFDVVKCTKGDKTECQLQLTPLKEDSKFYINSYTRMYDNEGNESYVSNITIANNSMEFRRQHPSDILKRLLISDVPTKLIVRFNGASKNAKMISALKIVFDVNEKSWGGKNTITFRNIELNRR